MNDELHPLYQLKAFFILIGLTGWGTGVYWAVKWILVSAVQR